MVCVRYPLHTLHRGDYCTRFHSLDIWRDFCYALLCFPPHWSSHGTQCAGIIAGENNRRCGVGLAYNAKIAGMGIVPKKYRKKNALKNLSFFKSASLEILKMWCLYELGYLSS